MSLPYTQSYSFKSFESNDSEDEKSEAQKALNPKKSRSQELVDEVNKKHTFPYGFPGPRCGGLIAGGLIAILGPGTITVLQFLIAFATKKCYPADAAEDHSRPYLIFGGLWFLVFSSSVYHYRTCRRFGPMTPLRCVYYWCIAVPAVGVHIYTCFALLLPSCSSYKQSSPSVVSWNLISALLGSYAVILPMYRVMQSEMHTTSQLILRWKNQAQELLDAMDKGTDFKKGAELINDYRATRKCMKFKGFLGPWLQCISLGVLTVLAVLVYYLTYGLDHMQQGQGEQHVFAVVLCLVGFGMIFRPLCLLEGITRPMVDILKNMQEVELRKEIPPETLQTYKLLLSVLKGERMIICLLQIPLLGISLDVDRKFILKAFTLLVFKVPTVIAALKSVIGKNKDEL